MKKGILMLLSVSFFTGTLFANGHNMNYHIHEGKMMNHKHPDFYPDHSKVTKEVSKQKKPNYWNNKTSSNALYEIQLKNTNTQ